MKRIYIFGLATALAVSTLAQSPQVGSPVIPPAANNKPALLATPLQQAQIESALKDLVILQLQYQAAQTALSEMQNKFTQQQAAVDVLATQAKTDNKWGADVQLNKITGKFEYVQPPPAPPTKIAPTPKEAPSKK